MKVKVLEHRGIVLIFKINMVEIHLSLNLVKGGSILAVRYLHRIVNGIKYLLKIGAYLGKLLDYTCNLCQRSGKKAHVIGKHNHCTCVDHGISVFNQSHGYSVQSNHSGVPEQHYNRRIKLIPADYPHPYTDTLVMYVPVGLPALLRAVKVLDYLLSHY